MESSRKSVRAVKKIKDLGKIVLKEEISASYRKVSGVVVLYGSAPYHDCISIVCYISNGSNHSLTTIEQISQILKTPCDQRTPVQNELLQISPEIVLRCEQNKAKREQTKARLEELPDSPADLEDKCMNLAAAIQRSNHLVVYTGAGISTAADIPDYRGPNGVWTLIEKGLSSVTKDLCEAEPTFTHMALVELMRMDKVKYIVSQNCDGLHVRSNVDREKLSEIHGNMFLEVCQECADNQEYMRLFDTTERTGVRRHDTGRKCHKCQSVLKDTIVHFGEKGSMNSPYHWEEARAAAESADMLLCLGTSLKVLRKYLCLWCMDRPKRRRPALYIVNLQWTPKDETALLKINGNCDIVMRRLAAMLNVAVPPYQRYYDALFAQHTPLLPEEQSSHTKKVLERGNPVSDHNYALSSELVKPEYQECEKSDTNSQPPPPPTNELRSPGWYGVGLRSSKSKSRKKRK